MVSSNIEELTKYRTTRLVELQRAYKFKSLLIKQRSPAVHIILLRIRAHIVKLSIRARALMISSSSSTSRYFPLHKGTTSRRSSCFSYPSPGERSRFIMGNLAFHSAEEPYNLKATTAPVKVTTKRDNDAALVNSTNPQHVTLLLYSVLLSAEEKLYDWQV